MPTKQIKLTPAQDKALRSMGETEYVFPPPGTVRSYEKLQELGFAESIHAMFKQVWQGSERTTEFRRKYRRTIAGTNFIAYTPGNDGM